jgi:hypothetical protein
MQQLTKSHLRYQKLEQEMAAMLRTSERRLQDSHRDKDRNVADVKRDMGNRIKELEEELSQCRKREDAIEKVFVQNYEKQQELAGERRRLEREDALLEEERESLRLQALDMADRKVDEQELKIKNIAAERGGEQTTESNETRTDENSITCASLHRHSFGAVKDLFKANPKVIDWKPAYSTSSTFKHLAPDVTDTRVFLMRRHDYYKGWLDCIKATDDINASVNWIRSDDQKAYLLNVRDSRNPENAGRNAGLSFMWSALCTEHGLPEHDVRLDNRTWNIEDLIPFSDRDDTGFWKGFRWGAEKMEKLFELKMESGIWKTDDDPKQVMFLRPSSNEST